MKHAPALDRVVGSSRAHLARAYLLGPDGAAVGRLPLDGGTVTASARPGDRWAADVVLAGESWAPTGPTHPLSGFTGHRIRLQLGALVDEAPVYVTVADLLVTGTRRNREAGAHALTVKGGGLAGWVAASAPQTYYPTPGESCQAMIGRLVQANRPPGWPPVTVADTSAAVPVPADYASDGRDAWTVVEDLAAIANVGVYVDAVQRLTIRPPLPTSPGPPARTLTAAEDVTDYEVEVGREGFANRVELRCSPVQAGQPAEDVVGVAEQTTGPLGTAAAGRVVYSAQQTTGTITQAAAEARAAALLSVTLAGWSTVVLTAVPDPRLEPDDDVAVTYPGGLTAVHRITEARLPLDTSAMTLACRTFVGQPLPLAARTGLPSPGPKQLDT